MALTVGELVAYMSIDNKRFDSGLAASGKALDQFGNIATEQGQDAGQQWAQSFTRDAAGRLRDSQGRLVSAARLAAMRAGQAAEDSFEDAFDPRLGGGRGVRGVFGRVLQGVKGAIGGTIGAFGRLGKAGVSAFQSFQGPVANVIKLLAVLTAAAVAPIGALGALSGVGAVMFGALQGGAVAAVGALAAIGITAAAQSQKVKSAFSSLKDDLASGLTQAAEPFEDVLVHIADTTRRVFTQDLQPALAGVFADMAPVVSGFFDDFASSLDPVISQLRPFVNDLLPSFNAAGRALDPIMAGVASMMNRVGSALHDTSPQFEAFLVNISRLFEPLGRLMAALVRIGARVLPRMANWLVGVTDGLADFTEQALVFTKKARLGEFFDAAVRSLGNFVQAFIAGLFNTKLLSGENGIDRIAQSVKDLTGWLNNPETQAAIKDFGRALGDFFYSLPENIANVHTFINQLRVVWSTVTFVFTHPLETARILLVILFNKIELAVWSGITSMLTSIIELLKPLPGRMEAPFVAAKNGVRTHMRQIRENTRNGLRRLTQNTDMQTNTIPPMFESAMSSSTLALKEGMGRASSTASSGASQVSSAIRPVESRIPGSFRSGYSSAVSASKTGKSRVVGIASSFAGAVNAAVSLGGVLWNEGRNMIRGLVNGMRSAWSWVTSTARSIARAAVNAARDALGSHSPSRVFMRVGRDVGAGLAIGIAQSQRRVENATRGMVAAAIGTAQTMTQPALGATGAPALAGAAGTPGGASPVYIENYYEQGRSAREVAEDFWYLSRARG